jgi:23S rRNA (adenine-N6)-dimethyltransferase
VAARQRRAWGWHPLTDAWAERIVADAGVRPGEFVVDLGAGHGALTGHLVAAGARVIAVELHPGRAARLRERFAAAPVVVVEADVALFRLPRRPYRVVANPPFALTSALIHPLLARDSALVAADIVLQRAVTRRFTDGGGPPRWHRRWSLAPGIAVPRSAFRPPPQVDARVLRIRRR